MILLADTAEYAASSKIATATASDGRGLFSRHIYTGGMTWKVLVGRHPHESVRREYDDWANVTVAAEYENPEKLDEDLPTFDAIVLGGIELPAERIERAANLKMVTSPGVGLDSIDIGAATENGIIVCNNLGANTRAVAEYSITTMLAVRRELRRADRNVRDGIWDKFDYMNPEVVDQTMGVFGYGAIGSLVLDLAQGLGMDTVAYDPYVETEAFDAGVEPVDTKRELFERSDAVGVHAPLTDETRGAVGEPELHALGEDGVLVNASRGPLVDTEALVEALRGDVIHGAAIDVFDEEPVPADHPLFELDDVPVPPHIAGSTETSVPAKHRGAMENVRTVYDGSLPDTTVNRDELCLRAAHDGDQPAGDIKPF
jgi:phosphoglycerate dehydrogenase-like enzyme